jgi:hypothetical protein
MKFERVAGVVALLLAIGLSQDVCAQVIPKDNRCGPDSTWSGQTCVGPRGKLYCPQDMNLVGRVCVRPAAKELPLAQAETGEPNFGCGPQSKWTGQTCVGPRGKLYCPQGMTLEGSTCKKAASAGAASPLLGPVATGSRRPAAQMQGIGDGGFAQPVKLMDGSLGMMFNNALYIRGSNGHWKRVAAGAYEARNRFTIRTGPDGAVLSHALRFAAPIAHVQQRVVVQPAPQGKKPAGLAAFHSSLPLRPVVQLSAPVLFDNTTLQVSTQAGTTPHINIKAGQHGSWDTSTTLKAFAGQPCTSCYLVFFRATTNPSAVKKLIWQVSSKAFPTSTTNTNWDAFPGLAKTGTLLGSPTSPQRLFSIDLSGFADFSTPNKHAPIYLVRVVPLNADGELAGMPSKPVYLVTPNQIVLPNNTALQVSTVAGRAPYVSPEFGQQGAWAASTTLRSDSGVSCPTCYIAYFRVTTDPSVVTKLVWQVSTIAFSASANANGKSVPGIVSTGTVPGTPASSPNVFSIDLRGFADFSTPGKHAPIYLVRVLPLAANGELAGLPSQPIYLVTPNQTQSTLGANVPAQKPAGPPPSPVSVGVTLASWQPALNVVNADWYLGPPAQPPSIVVTYPTSDADIVNAFPAFMKEYTGDAQGKLYRVYGGNANSTEIGTEQKGTTIYLDWTPPPDDDVGGVDAFLDFVKQVSGFIGDAVDLVSTTFTAIKSVAVDAVAVGIPGPYGHEIAGCIVDAALIYAGIPPTLPDMDELEDKGIGYVTDIAADQIGIDPSIVDAAQSYVASPDTIRRGIKSALAANDNARGDSVHWFVPSPQYLYHPPVAMLSATSSALTPANAALKSNPRDIYIQVRAKLPWGNDPSGAPLYAEQAENGMILWTGRVRIPPMAPGQTIQIPVVFDFSFNDPLFTGCASIPGGIGSNLDTACKNRWLETYEYANTGSVETVNGGAGTYTDKPLNQKW